MCLFSPARAGRKAHYNGINFSLHIDLCEGHGTYPFFRSERRPKAGVNRNLKNGVLSGSSDGTGRRPAVGRRRSLPGRAGEPALAQEPVARFCVQSCSAPKTSSSVIIVARFPPSALHFAILSQNTRLLTNGDKQVRARFCIRIPAACQCAHAGRCPAWEEERMRTRQAIESQRAGRRPASGQQAPRHDTGAPPRRVPTRSGSRESVCLLWGRHGTAVVSARHRSAATARLGNTARPQARLPSRARPGGHQESLKLLTTANAHSLK